MITESGQHFPSLPSTKLDSLLSSSTSAWLSNHGSGSGGFAENVFIASAKDLFDQNISSPLEFKVVKNSDFQVTSFAFTKVNKFQLSLLLQVGKNAFFFFGLVFIRLSYTTGTSKI